MIYNIIFHPGRNAVERGCDMAEIRTMVSDLFFLRLINPALVTPEAWGMAPPEMVSPAARKSLTLVGTEVELSVVLLLLYCSLRSANVMTFMTV